MNAKKFRAMLLVPLAVLLLGAGPLLVDPAPISVPQGLTDKAVAQAVRAGVSRRGWLIGKQAPGYLEATLLIRSHMAKIGVSYDTQAVSLKYLDSSNLDYKVKKDGPHIHGNYLKWANNVLHDVSEELLRTQALQEP